MGLVLEINGQVTNPTSVVKGNCRAPNNADGNILLFSFNILFNILECKYSLNYLSYFLERITLLFQIHVFPK